MDVRVQVSLWVSQKLLYKTMSTETSNADYGTVEYYKDCFDDIIADIGNSSDPSENIQAAFIVLQAFEQSINEWLSYHQSCAESYETMLDKFIYGKRLDRK